MKLRNFLPLIIALPSVVIGAVAMYLNKISIGIWSQNIVVLIILGFFSYLFLKEKPKISKSNSFGFIVPITIILLFLTFLDSGLDGVHRWVSIGPIKLNVASIMLPILIIELWRILKILNWWYSMIITIAISILLALQPDASQTTGFIFPMIILLLSKANKSVIRYSIISLISVIPIISWIFIDSLPPIDYVEEIVLMVKNLGAVWFLIGISSLALLPLPFIIFPSKNYRLVSICLGLYFIIILISTLFGNFPVPLMGYGISPIIGYFIAITWLLKVNTKVFKLQA
ncbi:cell division protein [Alkaliphilus peptidifermentans]|uniref:Cell cycle protein n=1 Tax=Alkaliphilus peptidifermentans DSM 18978 TaxID=1120976 RepID=A0A1G5GSD9_9FIRM|nr:cell division protein [Alkaliphilus peptidifermentans]SCY54466.1 hypothetical protein SAMN03080606_01761 [Alkaliphilus peptidifermentans DSM 18978]